MTDIADRTAERLRAEMTDRIVTYRLSIPGMRPVPDRVLAVMRHVPRHAFLPGTSLEEAYSAESVITKRAGDGSALSCASKPTVVALRPGWPPTVTDEQVGLVITRTLEEEGPAEDTHWSTRSMAAATSLSQTAVSRI